MPPEATTASPAEDMTKAAAIADVPNATDTAPQPDSAAASTPSEGATAASPAADETGAKPAPEKSLADIVRSAVEGAKGNPPDPEKKPDQEAAAEAAKPEAEKTAEGKADEDEQPPFHTHPRWKQMVAERDSLKAPADQYRQIEAFMHAAGLTPQEVATGYDIMAEMKRNPAAAKQRLLGYVARIDEFLGETVPDDIRVRLDDGRIDEDTARELARARAQSRNADAAARAAQAERQRLEQQQTQQASMQAAVGAVNAWESKARAADPDFDLKADLIAEVGRSIASREGQPQTADQAVAIVQRAYEQVNAQVRKFRPAKTEVRPSPTTSMAVQAKPQPKSLQEAVAIGLSM